MDIEEKSCYYTARYALSSHDLSCQELDYAAAFVVKCWKKSGDAKTTLEFLALSDKRTVAKYARRLNSLLDEAIIDKDKDLFLELMEKAQDYAVEFHENRHFSSEHGRTMIAPLVASKRSLFENIKRKIENGEDFDQCSCESCPDSLFTDRSTSADTIQTVDIGRDGHVQKCSVDREYLLDVLMEDEPINPCSRKPFSRYTLHLLRKKLHTEWLLHNGSL